jgi:hypothetical protein
MWWSWDALHLDVFAHGTIGLLLCVGRGFAGGGVETCHHVREERRDAQGRMMKLTAQKEHKK